MVDFLRDVILAVALLATLIAVAFHPNQEPVPQRHSELDKSRLGTSGVPARNEMLARRDEPSEPGSR